MNTVGILKAIGSFIHDNQLILGLVVSAIFGTMPSDPPVAGQRLAWLYGWFHDCTKTLLNFKPTVTLRVVSPAAELVKPVIIPPQQPELKLWSVS